MDHPKRVVQFPVRNSTETEEKWFALPEFEPGPVANESMLKTEVVGGHHLCLVKGRRYTAGAEPGTCPEDVRTESGEVHYQFITSTFEDRDNFLTRPSVITSSLRGRVLSRMVGPIPTGVTHRPGPHNNTD